MTALERAGELAQCLKNKNIGATIRCGDNLKGFQVVEIHIFQRSGYDGDVVKYFINKAEELGAEKTGVRGTGEIYARFRD